MTLVDSAIQALRRAAEMNLSDSLRSGSLLSLPDRAQLVLTGDMHGHRRNFEKLIKYCKLETTPIRHVVLHELIHKEPEEYGGPDLSFEMLLDAAKWKTFFPSQVHFLQSNHELAQLQNHQITKGGRIVTAEFERGVAKILETGNVDAVLEAIDLFIASYPVAGVTPNGVFFAHSLPDVAYIDLFDTDCVNQEPEDLDLSEGGMIYKMVWGRRHTPALLDRLGRAYSARFFVIGHQPQESGYSIQQERIIILSSDNNHGAFLPIDCSKEYTIEQLEAAIRPFAGVL